MFEHCLYFNTTALARVVEREWARAFRPLELTPSQAFMLRLLLERPGLLQHALAEGLTISRPTATRLLDGLEARGLVERRTCAQDGRGSEIYPTSRARQLKAALNRASADATRRVKHVIGDDMFAETVARLGKIRSTLR